MRLSLDRGSPQKLAKVDSIADGLAAPWAGDLTFEHVRRLGVEIVTVNDAAIADAMWTIIERCKVVAEPAGAAGLAALLAGAVTVPAGCERGVRRDRRERRSREAAVARLRLPARARRLYFGCPATRPPGGETRVTRRCRVSSRQARTSELTP